MFRQMRNRKNGMTAGEAEDLLRSCRRGVLAVDGEEGYPYAVPVNYLYDNETGRIIFHGAKSGYKADCLKADDRVCFTVYGSETVREEDWAPFVQSAVVFGRCRIIREQEDIDRLLKKFAMKYYPDERMADEEIARSGKAAWMFEIRIEHISGKQVQEK